MNPRIFSNFVLLLQDDSKGWFILLRNENKVKIILILRILHSKGFYNSSLKTIVFYCCVHTFCGFSLKSQSEYTYDVSITHVDFTVEQNILSYQKFRFLLRALLHACGKF